MEAYIGSTGTYLFTISAFMLYETAGTLDLTVNVEGNCPSSATLTPSTGINQIYVLGGTGGSYELPPFTVSDNDCTIWYLPVEVSSS